MESGNSIFWVAIATAGTIVVAIAGLALGALRDGAKRIEEADADALTGVASAPRSRLLLDGVPVPDVLDCIAIELEAFRAAGVLSEVATHYATANARDLRRIATLLREQEAGHA
jgi:hypothetical protein